MRTTPAPEIVAPPKPRMRGRIHQVASLVSIPAAVALVVVARGLSARLAAAIYGVTLVNMFATSGLYHRRSWTPRSMARVQSLDHSAIYLLIAGSYTPLTVLALRGPVRVALLATVWGGAAIGVTLKLLRLSALQVLFGALYICLGWAAVAAAPQFIHALPPAATALIVAGGVLYTAGAAVLSRRRPDPNPLVFGYHEVWHALMTSAAACHYTAILLVVLAAR